MREIDISRNETRLLEKSRKEKAYRGTAQRGKKTLEEMARDASDTPQPGGKLKEGTTKKPPLFGRRLFLRRSIYYGINPRKRQKRKILASRSVCAARTCHLQTTADELFLEGLTSRDELLCALEVLPCGRESVPRRLGELLRLPNLPLMRSQ